MAEGSVLKGIKDSWSLMEFARKMGAPKLARLTAKETGEEFSALMFPTAQTLPNGERRDFTMVAFSSNLGVLTPQEIADQKDELQIVQLESDTYHLCRKGAGAWLDINLF